MSKENDWKEKLIALCEGLELENLNILLEKGTIEDFSQLGKRLAERIKELVLAPKFPKT